LKNALREEIENQAASLIYIDPPFDVGGFFNDIEIAAIPRKNPTSRRDRYRILGKDPILSLHDLRAVVLMRDLLLMMETYVQD
jgi:16S rRNA G966 N2-methylase RsmD